MESKFDEQVLIMKTFIDSNEKKIYDDFTNAKSGITKTKTMFKPMMDQKHIYSPGKVD